MLNQSTRSEGTGYYRPINIDFRNTFSDLISSDARTFSKAFALSIFIVLVSTPSYPLMGLSHLSLIILNCCSVIVHSESVLSVVINSTSEMCFSGSADSTIICWSIPSLDIDPYGPYGKFS